MFRNLTTTGSLIAFLTLAACDPGDFCDVVDAEIVFAPETALEVVRTDRADAQRIAVQNEYGRKNCSWGR